MEERNAVEQLIPKAISAGQSSERNGDKVSFQEGGICQLDPEVVEVSMLLLGRQAAALEAEARCRGITTAQLIRQLIRHFLGEEVLSWAVIDNDH
jgi:hypothetical protein